MSSNLTASANKKIIRRTYYDATKNNVGWIKMVRSRLINDSHKHSHYCPARLYWTLGNHDDVYHAKTGLTGNNLCREKSIIVDNWRIILLDSIAPGLDDGFLGNVDFAHLHHCLKQHPEKPTIIILHQPPLEIGCYMDATRLINDKTFLTTIAQYPQIRAVLFGHIHQTFQQQYQRVLFAGAPSTCIQFKPHQATFAIDSTLTPGYRWVEFMQQQLTTDIIRI